MSTPFTVLTMLVIAQSRPPAPASPDALLYALRRDIERMQAQLADLHAMVTQLERAGVCTEEPRTAAPPVSSPPPPPLAAAPAARKAPPPARGRQVGIIEGRLSLDGIPHRTAYVFVINLKETPVQKAATIRQRNRLFVPNHMVVQSGTKIAFPNEDNEAHHVFSVGKFDLGYATKNSPVQEQVLVEAGVVEINCHSHPAMHAEVLVVPNRHWAKVNPDGSFRLAGVPAGARTVGAWTPGSDIAEQRVTVRADRVEEVAIKLDPPKRRGAR